MFLVSKKQCEANARRMARISRAVVMGLLFANLWLIVGLTATVHATPLHDQLTRAFIAPGTTEKLALMLAAPQTSAGSIADMAWWATLAGMIAAFAIMSAGSFALARSLRSDIARQH